MSEKKRVLMVCLGNICRSPIAEAVFRDQVNKMGLNDSWEVDSAALVGYHTGKEPDPRAMTVLEEKGITNYHHKARLIQREDFQVFDWIFGMDEENLEGLNRMRPKNSRAKIELLVKYEPSGFPLIRDPYYDGNTAGFQAAYQLCMNSITAFLEKHKDSVS